MQRKPRGRYQRLEDELERSNQDYIEDQRHQQQVYYDNSLIIFMTYIIATY
jgi:uncharacterized circularly permuted ATP-grasp superfamily protein